MFLFLGLLDDSVELPAGGYCLAASVMYTNGVRVSDACIEMGFIWQSVFDFRRLLCNGIGSGWKTAEERNVRNATFSSHPFLSGWAEHAID